MRTIQCQYCHGVIELTTSVNGVTTCPICGAVNAVPKLETLPEAYAAILQGQILLSACKFEEAKAAFEHAIQFDDMEPSAYFNLALANFKVQYLYDEVNERYQPICYDVSERKFTDDPNYLKSLLHATHEQKKLYEQRGKEIDDVRDEFYHLQTSGLDYDCFVCVKVTDDGKRDEQGNKLKTADSIRADAIYNYLKAHGYKPFYSEMEIQGRTGSKYEALILYALYKSECMLIVCSDEDYLDTPWVRNEYTRFTKMVDNNAKERDALTFVFDGNPIEKLPTGKRIQGIDYKWNNKYDVIAAFVEKHTPRAKQKLEEQRKKALQEEEARKQWFAEQQRKMEQWQAEQAKLFEEQQKQLEAQQKAFEEERKRLEEERKKQESVQPQQKVKQPTKQSQPKTAKQVQAITYPTLDNYNEADFEIEGTVLKKYEGTASEVVIPNGVTEISERAFFGAEHVTNVIIPDSVTKIGYEAFYICSNLKSIVIPNSVITIEAGAFNSCSSLASVTIPDGVTEIGGGTFENCSSLTNITIPNSVKEIYENAFFDCSSLTKIVIPDTVTYIGSYAFLGCSALNMITVERGNPVYHSKDNCLIRTEFCELVAGCKNSVIPTDGSVLFIGDCAFHGRNSIRTLTIPDGVIEIGDWAFERCSSLTNITIPDSVTEIKERAFNLCENLTSITVPDSVVEIGNRAFDGCIRLKNVTLPRKYERELHEIFGGEEKHIDFTFTD